MHSRDSRLRAGALLLAGLSLGVSACAVAPLHPRQNVALPAKWQGSTPLSPAPAASWPEADWWQGFGLSRLDQLVAQALESGDDLAAAVARVREADAQARIAGAPLLPTIALDAAATRMRTLSPVTGTQRTYTEYSPQVAASYEVDFWGRNRAAHASALYEAEAMRFDRATVALTVVGAVASSDFELRALNDRIRVAQDDLQRARRILDGLTLEQKVGTATALDVAQQAAAVAALDASLPPLQQQRREVTDALAVLVGTTPESFAEESGGLDEVAMPPVVQGLPSSLLARRPDVAYAEAQLQAANADLAAARAAFLPSFELTAGGGYASTTLQNLLLPQSRIFALTAGLTETIFDHGARSGAVEYRRARRAELLADYHRAVIGALGNVEDALSAVQQATEQSRRQQQAVDTARQAFEFAQRQMAAGVTNVLTVLNTESALFGAQDTMIQVKLERLQALVRLYQALGGGWQSGAEVKR